LKLASFVINKPPLYTLVPQRHGDLKMACDINDREGAILFADGTPAGADDPTARRPVVAVTTSYRSLFAYRR
jgi:hypothetical protein